MNKKYINWSLIVVLTAMLALGCAGKRGSKADLGSKLIRRDKTAQNSENRQIHQISQEQLQLMVMNMSDYITVSAMAVGGDLFHDLEDPEKQSMLFGKVYNLILASITIAISSDPERAYLNMLIMVTMARTSFEQYWLPEVFGEKGQPYLEAMREIEQEVWNEADDFLSDDQQDILHELIDQWLEDRPDLRTAAWVRFTDFTDTKNAKSQEGILLAQGLLSEVTEATVAVDQARLLGERAMFLATRIPSLISWRSELTVIHLSALPQTKQLLADINLVSQAPDKVIATINDLSEQAEHHRDEILEHLTAEREAAIDQMMDRVALEREAMFDSLAQEEEKVRQLLADIERALAAGEKLAVEVNKTAASVDAVALRFGIDATREKDAVRVGEPVTFADVRQYTNEISQAVAQATVLAETANRILESPAWDERENELNWLMASIQQSGKSWIDTAFIRAVFIAALFFAGMLTYRWASNRLAGKHK